jgi:hypothetical protein
MLGLLLSHIRKSLLSAADRETSLHATLISNQRFRKGRARHVTWLVFVGDEVEPRFIARQAVEPGANEALEREAALSEEINSRLPAPLAPPVLDSTTINGLRVLISPYIAGSRSVVAELAQVARIGGVDVDDARRLFARHFDMASRVLFSLRDVPPKSSEQQNGESEAGYLLHEALSWFGPEHRNQMGLTRGALESIFDTVANSASGPASVVHFDTVPGNILAVGENLVLVDWETARWSTFWWFDPLKFVYMYLADLNRFGIIEDGDNRDPVSTFLHFLGGAFTDFHDQAEVFLESMGFPVGERDAIRSYWLAFALCEMKLFLSVSDNPEVNAAPYGRLIGGLLDLGDSPGSVQEQLERLQEIHRTMEREHASLQAQHTTLQRENNRLQDDNNRLHDDNNRLHDDNNRLQDDNDRLRAALELRSNEVVQLQAQVESERTNIEKLRERLRLAEDELAHIWDSRLWKVGSVYWKILSWMGRSLEKDH